MRPVPWHVKGVHPDVREVARDAARRSGVSVGAWLNSLIVNAAETGESPEGDDMPAAAAPPAPASGAARAPSGEALTSIGRQIDELKWRLENLARDGSAREAAADATAWRVEPSRERVSSRHLSSSIWRPIELSASPAGARAEDGAGTGDASARGADSPIGDSPCSAAVMMREFSQAPTETPERRAASRATSRASG